MILATGAVHSHLVREGLRTYTSINVRSAECLDTHYFAVLIGVGATTINAYLAQDCIADRHARGLFGKMALGPCVKRYLDTVNAGLLKIMSKMGISVISSYRGAYNFEAVGLSRSMVAESSRACPAASRASGFPALRKKVARLHARAFDDDMTALPIGGFYKRARRRRDACALRRPDPYCCRCAVPSDSYAALQEIFRGRVAAAAGFACAI